MLGGGFACPKERGAISLPTRPVTIRAGVCRVALFFGELLVGPAPRPLCLLPTMGAREARAVASNGRGRLL